MFDRASRALAGALAALVLVAAGSSRVFDPDVWWVAAAGRAMLRDGHVPRENAFSFTAPLHPWVMHEWLWAAPYAVGLRALGPPFFALVALAFAGATVALVLDATLGRSRGRWAPLLAAAALVCFTARLSSARPANASLLFAVAMARLAFSPRFGRAHAAGAVALELAWTQAHGSFPLGVALLAAASLERGLPCRRARALTALFAALATLANPYGLALHALVLEYLLGSRGAFAWVHQHVAEFAPLARSLGALDSPDAFVALLGRTAGVALVALLVAASWRARPVRALVALALLATAFAHVRNVELCGLVSVVLLAPRDPSPPEGRARLARGALLVAPGLVAGLVAFAIARTQRPPLGWIDDSIGGPAFVALLERAPRGARLRAPFTSDGLAIWYGEDRGVRVFYDPRNDCYPVELAELDDALGRVDTPAGTALEVLARYRVDAVIERVDRPLARTLARASGWTEVDRDGAWRSFAAR